MSTITKEFTKEQLIEKLQHRVAVTANYPDVEEAQLDAAIFKIALASLEAEAVALRDERSGSGGISKKPGFNDLPHGTPLYAAPPAPVALPVQHWEELCRQNPDMSIGDAIIRAAWWNHCAAMLQGAEPVTTAYKLPDEFDFDRFNDVVWLEAVASNPHMHSPTTSTIAMVALELNRKLSDRNSPVIPDGWVLVPVEPTAEMISSGITAHYERSQIQIHDRPAPGPMECAYVAMLAAASQQEVK